MNWRFWHKKTEPADPAEQATESGEKKQKKRSWLLWPWRICKYAIVLIIVLILVVIAASGYITQTESGQRWLTQTINKALAPNDQGIGVKITRLNGSIPADFQLGLELYDPKGLWLSVPQISFAWLWRELPGAIHIKNLTVQELDLIRSPDLPPEAPEPEEAVPPLTVQDIQNMLAEAADFLQEKHWYLPDIIIDQIALDRASLPEDWLPSEGPQRLLASASANFSFIDNKTAVTTQVAVQNAKAENLALPSLHLKSVGANLALNLKPTPAGLMADMQMGAHVQKPELEVDALPDDFLGKQPEFSLGATATVNTKDPAVEIALSGPALDAGQLKLGASGAWHSDDTWKQGLIAGPIHYKLNLDLLPIAGDSPLAAIREPVAVTFHIKGDLPAISAKLTANCDNIIYEGHRIKDTAITLTASDIDLPLNEKQLRSLEEESALPFTAKTVVDDRAVNIATNLFFQALAQSSPSDAKGWRVGLRDLLINALGLQGQGQLAALLPEEGKPAIDGQLNLEVKEWREIASFLPGKSLSGDVRLSALLHSNAPEPLQRLAPQARVALPLGLDLRQYVQASVTIPQFSLQDGSSKIAVDQFQLDALVNNVFDIPDVNVQVRFQKVKAADLTIGGNAHVQGSIKGPIQAAVNTSGSVESKIAAQWLPGRAQIGTLDIMANIAPLVNKGSKPFMVGLKAAPGAEITYGDHGLTARNVDWRITPQGRLQINGALSPGKLDLAAKLDDLALKPWQKLIPEIPGGSVALAANLNGTHQRPGGAFRLHLKDIAISKNPLGPLTLAVNGDIVHNKAGSALNINLEADPKTVKTLGGNVAQITASLPLLFEANGIPKPNMKGPLGAKVRWDGALGPIWNLVPVADQRLNGRIAINVDAAGSLERPNISGKVEVARGRYENLMAGVLLTDINATIALADEGRTKARGPLDSLPGKMRINASISDGRGGTIKTSGSGALNGSELNIQTKIDKLKPLRRRDVHVELSGQVNVTGNAASPLVAGEIIVDKGEVLLNNIAVTGSVTTLDITDPTAKKNTPKKATATKKTTIVHKGKTAAKKKEPSGPGQLDIRIVMPPRFSVEGRGLASLWKANLLISGPLTDPKISGNISCARGNFDFLGKNFALSRGIVFFAGGAISNPLVDMDLTYDTPDLTAHILVTGPADKIKLSMTSDPSLPQDEILSRVLFGRSVSDLSRAEALQLAGAVAQLAGFGGGPFYAAKKALGVDVLRLGTSDTGATGDDNAGGTNIEMGKYLNDFIYVGIQQGFKPDSTAFIMDVELTPRTSLELRSEQNNTWGGLKWRMNY